MNDKNAASPRAGLSRRDLLRDTLGLGVALSATSAFSKVGDVDGPSGGDPHSTPSHLPRNLPEGPFILTAANILTMDARQSEVQAVGVHGGRIRVVGTLDKCQEALPQAPTIDLGSATLMPGFIEPHSHPVASGMSTEAPAYNVAPWLVPTWAGIEAVARKAAREVPAGNSIVLFGLDRLLHQCNFPDATVMDALFGDRIAAIIALSQHQCAITTAALHSMGWDTSPPPDPAGGEFHRRPDGSLDGIASEMPAVLKMLGPILAALGGNPLEQAAAYVARLGRAGITTMADLGYQSNYRHTYEALCALPSHPVRVSLYHATNDPSYLEPFTSTVPESLLTKGGIKFWADGSPWLGTIATSFPYLDSEAVQRAGITDLFPREKALNYNRDELDAMLATNAEAGWQVACHANGDLTIDLVLDAYEEALTAQGLLGTDHRWRLEHVGATRPDQLERMSRLGVVPTFALFQMMQWGDLLDGQLYTSEHGARWSPVGDAQATDAHHLHQSYHNDGNISQPSPLGSVQAAVLRRSNRVDADGSYHLASGHVHGPDQRVALTTALRAITINAAYILHREHEVGSIEPGKYADFVQLSENPFDVNPRHLIDEVEVIGTWLAGRPVDLAAFVRESAVGPVTAKAIRTRQELSGCCSTGPVAQAAREHGGD